MSGADHVEQWRRFRRMRGQGSNQGSSKEGLGQLTATVRASTGARIRVWREDELFYARLAQTATEPQICVAVDLFEVIAELAGLSLEESDQSAEAMRLSLQAQRQLGVPAEVPGDGGDVE
jgi:hypothetical protein